ncbi:MAG: hypothetical protein ACYDH9_23930 [Limisphaerales bacterium]
MQLGEEDIREFRDIWREEFKETISPEEAHHRASLLLELYALLAGLPPEQSSGSLSGTSHP